MLCKHRTSVTGFVCFKFSNTLPLYVVVYVLYNERTENFTVLSGTVPSVLKILESYFDDEAIPYRKQFHFISQPCRSRLNLS